MKPFAWLAMICVAAVGCIASAQTEPMPRPSPEERAAPRPPVEAVVPDLPATSYVSGELTEEEQARFRQQVASCWNIGGLEGNIRVTLAFDMTPDARPVPDSVELIDHSDGNPEDVEDAFQAARRAVIRCGLNGYDLPAEAYHLWQRVELVFDPAIDRLR